MSKIKWNKAPIKTTWGAGIVQADIEIDADHTLSIYCEDDQTAKVELMLHASALQAVTAERDALKEDLIFIERCAVHHAMKLHMTPEQVLSCIAHYPPIKAITKSYVDGVLPTTPDPYAENAAMKGTS